MRSGIISVLALLAAFPLLASSWLDEPRTSQQVLSDRANIHQTVVALEQDPLHKNAELFRGLLLAHYKKVDYIICGQVLGPLTKSKELEPVMFQIVIASGDWVEANPDRTGDIDAYTLAGLESGLRAYKNLLKVKPKATHKLLDELLARYENGTLNEWNLKNPCRAE